MDDEDTGVEVGDCVDVAADDAGIEVALAEDDENTAELSEVKEADTVDDEVMRDAAVDEEEEDDEALLLPVDGARLDDEGEENNDDGELGPTDEETEVGLAGEYGNAVEDGKPMDGKEEEEAENDACEEEVPLPAAMAVEEAECKREEDVGILL